MKLRYLHGNFMRELIFSDNKQHMYNNIQEGILWHELMSYALCLACWPLFGLLAGSILGL